MAQTKKPIGPTTQKRREIIYELYLEMYQEEGEKAHLLPRSYYYERLADKTGYSSTSVAIYLNDMMRGNG